MSGGAPLDIVVLGLSITSSWGNGHATTWRALLRAFAERGHRILFLERDMPWYAAHRDLPDPGYCRIALYDGLPALVRDWAGTISDADAVIIGSYVPEGAAAARLVRRLASGAVAFYDIDTPVTVAALAEGRCEYLDRGQLAAFDLVLSFTGGPMLDRLCTEFGARDARVLHCSVDADAYRPRPDCPRRWDLSYLGTYGADRQPALERLLIAPARRAPHLRFAVAGPQYPAEIDWPANVERLDHVAPGDHPAFYAASRYTLNVTRADMVRAGWSPSVRLFEAAACGTPIISDAWPGLAALFHPRREIVVAESTEEVLHVLSAASDAERDAMGAAARRRVLATHTARHRAAELEAHLRDAIAAGRSRASARIAEHLAT